MPPRPPPRSSSISATLGFRTEIARTGDEALDRARASRPDLVVLDAMLPGRSGLDVCRALRGDSAVPIILLSARSTGDDKLVGLDLGADDYVTKPFSPRELVARVRVVLRRGAPPDDPITSATTSPSARACSCSCRSAAPSIR